MTIFFRKLKFVNRHLRQNDPYYRTALVFGPATLIGVLLAFGVWVGLERAGKENIGRAGQHPLPGWAVKKGNDQYWNAEGQPITVEPAAPLPSIGADGSLNGFRRGWGMHTSELQINALDANILTNQFTVFSIDGPSFQMSKIMETAPKTVPIYIGIGSAFLAIRTAGIYSISAHLERPAGPQATCLSRLVLGDRRILSSIDINLKDDVLKTFDPIQFDLRPGLYKVAMAFSCWRDNTVSNLGKLTLFIAHPGENSLMEAKPDDVVRLN